MAESIKPESIAWYNGYSPTKVPHFCDFQCVKRNMDKIKGHAAFSMDINGRLIT